MNGLTFTEVVCKAYTGYVMTRIQCPCGYYDVDDFDREAFRASQLVVVQEGLSQGISLDEMEAYAKNEVMLDSATLNAQIKEADKVEDLSDFGRELMGYDDAFMEEVSKQMELVKSTNDHMSHLEWEQARSEVEKAL